ncbi:MAG: peroxiredoxin [Pseudomonadota bacterium]
MLKKGDRIPMDIKVLDIDGKKVSLKTFEGKYLVVYFYPKDNTPGCNKEACSFRDNYKNITSLGADVVGISKDSVSSHEKFMSKFNLNFHLWSDPDKELFQAFGAWDNKKLLGNTFLGAIRSTFVINPKGIIIKVWEKVNVKDHAEEIYSFLEKEIK